MIGRRKVVPGVLASFQHVDAATDAIKGLKARGFRDLTVYTAAPNHEIEDALDEPVSWVRMFTLVGGLIGVTSGFAMTFWMSLDWPLLVGGKPIASAPPYVAIAFELTILYGALSTVLGMLLLSLRKSLKGRAFNPRFTDDRIGIFVPCSSDKTEVVRSVLTDAGSEEVTVHAA